VAGVTAGQWPGNENDPEPIEAARLTKQRALKTIISVRNPQSTGFVKKLWTVHDSRLG
jgi:hypothetical protein